MRKTLALLLAAACLYLTPSPSVSVKSQGVAASTKFHKVANPIPNRYIVVLASTDLTPIAAPAATPINKGGQVASDSSVSTSAAAAATPANAPDDTTYSAVPADPVVVATANELTSLYGGIFSLIWSAAIKGFGLDATEAEAEAMSRDSRVAFVIEDSAIAVGTPDTDPILMTPDPAAGDNPQPNASWGLDRIDQRSQPLDKLYASNNDGTGVNVYVIDTGILTTHEEFRGRAYSVYDVFESEGGGVPCNGHGSHVAGIIGGRTFGVAQNVRLFSVRVLDCAGIGTWSNVIDGVNFVTWHRRQSAQQGIPAVANMSLGGLNNRAADAAVRNSIRAGVIYVVAAGNAGVDASTYSPAGVPEAITVGATDKNDFRAEFSNWGSAVDLFAPGVSIPSAWIGNDLMIATASGTSMAAPHVAGVVALYLQTHRTATPTAVRSVLVSNSTEGVIRNPGSESPNRLLFTDY